MIQWHGRSNKSNNSIGYSNTIFKIQTNTKKFVTSTLHIREIRFSSFAHNFALTITKNYLIFEHII